jgi:hypothetical protein
LERLGKEWNKQLEESIRNPRYQMVEVIKHNHVEFWHRVHTEKPYDFSEVSSDNRTSVVTIMEGQLEKYPNAFEIAILICNSIFATIPSTPFSSLSKLARTSLPQIC